MQTLSSILIIYLNEKTSYLNMESIFKYMIMSVLFSIFILLKWVFNYRACTFGYYECKIRNVKKNKGFINNFCEYFGDLIYSEYNYIYFIILLIIYFNIFHVKNISRVIKFYLNIHNKF